MMQYTSDHQRTPSSQRWWCLCSRVWQGRWHSLYLLDRIQSVRCGCGKTKEDQRLIHACLALVESAETWTPAVTVKDEVKFSHTCYRALGPELIPVYRQSGRRWLFKSPPGGCLPLLYARPAITFSAKQRVTVFRPVQRYTAWWQRHIGADNLPKVATQLSPAENRAHDLMTTSPTIYR